MIRASEHRDPWDLIKEVGQEAVMSHFLGIEVGKGLYTNPLRKDNNPSCAFKKGSNGVLYFRDFPLGKSYTIMDIIMEKYKVSYKEAVKILQRELPLVSQHSDRRKGNLEQDVLLEVVQKSMDEDLWYWQQFGISAETLTKYGVSAVKTVYRNGDLYMRRTKTNPIFVYSFPSGRLKLYRPLSPSRKGKWYGNAGAEDIGGME